MISLPFDVAGPGLVVALGLGVAAATVFMAVILLTEAVVLRLMRWGTFWRSLLASLLMNLVSSLVGLFMVSLIVLGGVAGAAAILVSFVASVLIEGGVLMLMNRGHARLNWMASLVANVVSYVPAGILYAVVVVGGGGL